MAQHRNNDMIRLQKFLADAGVASRRNAEELILEGRVLVNGEVVDALPAFVDPESDEVIVDGRRVRPHRPTYGVVYKPTGVVAAARDPAGRRRIFDLLPPEWGRVVPVGRMDAEASGVVFVTNDGELAERLADTWASITSQYQVEVRGHAEPSLIGRLRHGVFLSEGKAAVVAAEIRHAARDRSVLWVEIRERINRQLRRMLAQLGFPVRKLHRITYGPLRAKGMGPGAARLLTMAELNALQNVAEKLDKSQSKLRRAAWRGKPRPEGVARQMVSAEEPADDFDAAESSERPTPTKRKAGHDRGRKTRARPQTSEQRRPPGAVAGEARSRKRRIIP